MNHASLFTGIGGFDLAARWMGWNNVFQVEIDKFCHKVLNKNFPETDKHRDIYEFDGTQYTGQIDILTGGFPCQPFSTAGKRMGESDDRYLWPQMFRVIREVQPPWVVCENVAGILSMGNSERAWRQIFSTMENKIRLSGPYYRFFGRKRELGVLYGIIEDLKKEGYAVQTFSIPASAVGAIHRRDRVWIIAHNEKRVNGKHYTEPGKRQESESGKSVSGSNAFKGRNARELLRTSEPPVCRTDDGVPPELDRREQLKALGNAIVPQVAYEIFRAIESN